MGTGNETNIQLNFVLYVCGVQLEWKYRLNMNGKKSILWFQNTEEQRIIRWAHDVNMCQSIEHFLRKNKISSIYSNKLRLYIDSKRSENEKKYSIRFWTLPHNLIWIISSDMNEHEHQCIQYWTFRIPDPCSKWNFSIPVE